MNVYKREFSVSEGNELYLPDGEASMCFEIGFPPEGKITRLQVRQSPDDASTYAFQVDLFDRQVCELGSLSSYSEDADTMSVELAKILPTQTANAGEAVNVTNAGYSYRNREGTYAVPVRKVYLRIGVTGASSSSSWEVAIAAETGGALT